MPFLTEEPALRLLACGTEFELLDSLVYEGRDERWTVPAGFRTDLASIPSIVSWLVSKLGLWSLAAIIHDFFCSVGIRRGLITARDTDAVFRRVMREHGVGVVLRWLIWVGVRWGALFNPIRRPEWHKDAPLVLLLSIPALALALLPTVAVLLSLAVLRLVEFVASPFKRQEPTS